MAELSPGLKLSHYQIVSKLGADGMGEVYLAQDTKLDRKVALKILPADLASDRDRMEGFVREAKSAAALSHPNIAQIFEIVKRTSSLERSESEGMCYELFARNDLRRARGEDAAFAELEKPINNTIGFHND
jgi:serine/threonine protein kinase